MTYEELLVEADKEHLITKEKPLKYNNGRIKGNRIAIRKDIPTLAQKATVLAEELGHYHTTVGNILDQTDVSNRKQERRARLWAYDKLIGSPELSEDSKPDVRAGMNLLSVWVLRKSSCRKRLTAILRNMVHTFR